MKKFNNYSPKISPVFKTIFMMINSIKHDEFNEKLLTLITSTPINSSSSSSPMDASFTNLFTLVSHYINFNHYFLLQTPELTDKYFILCSDVIIPDTPTVLFPESFSNNEMVDLNNNIKFKKYDSQQVFFGNCKANSVALIHVSDSINLVLFDVDENLLKDDESRFMFTHLQSAILLIYKMHEVDYDYTIKEIYSFSEDYLDNLSKISFCITDYCPSEIFIHTLAYFIRGNISNNKNENESAVKVKEIRSATININDRDMIKYMVELRRHYNNVPYHNWFHALDVTQYVYSIIKQVNLKKYLTNLEIFGLLFSSLCHDTDHNGMNNNFHRKAHTVFAHLAPNLPPLEHHHSCITMDLARNLFMQIPDENDRLYLSHFIINCIMATDMEQHKVFIDQFKGLQNNGFNINEANHRLLLARIILKAGDLSNTVRNFSEAVKMTTKLNNECHKQGDEEERLKLPISPMCDRNDKTPMCVGQIGFYKFVAGPLMKELHTFFGESLIDNENQFQSNIKKWEEMKEELENSKGDVK